MTLAVLFPCLSVDAFCQPEQSKEEFLSSPEVQARIREARLKPRAARTVETDPELELAKSGPTGLSRVYPDNDSQPAVRDYFAFEQGSPFPDSPIDIGPSSEFIQKVKERVKTNAKETLKRLSREMLEEERAIPDLGACTESRSIKTTSEHPEETSQLQTLKDMLFLAEAPPGDPAELFGRSTVVKTFKPDQNGHLSRWYKAVAVPCLPFRMRQIGTGIMMRDFGANALRNFDKDPLGKGELHPAVKQYLNALKEGGAP